jgi:hypothetical protein
MPTILLKKSDTASAVPSTANLTNLAGGAEVAVNTADKRMFTMNSSSAVVELGTNPSSLTCADVSATLIKAASANITNLSAASATVTTGNLNFSSTAQRITGDFSNATPASRLAFQSSTSNGNTNVMVLPNGTGTVSGVVLESSSDLNSSSNTQLLVINGSDSRITSGIRGTGTYLPMTFYTGGSERVRIDTSGNVGIGRAPNYQLDVYRSGTTNTTIAAANDNIVNILQVSGNTAGVVGTITSHPLIFTAGNTERMRIDSSGNVGIGGTANAQARVNVTGTLPTSINRSRSFFVDATIPSGTTTNAINFYSLPSTENASFTLTDLYHFFAVQGTKGASSTITNQYGFSADSSLTGATNNFGFYSNIAAASDRWNFYAAGTARNYFAGGVEDAAGNLRAIPRTGSAKTTSYTLATTDVGQFVEVGSGGSVTVPNSTFATGDVVSIFNNTSGNVTLTMSITTAYIGGTDADKNTITLATRGVATILFISGTVCVVNGNVS